MLLIIASTPLETTLLRQQMRNGYPEQLGSTRLLSGNLHRQHVLLAHSGVGQTAMACQLTRLLTKYSPQAVLLCGCGGSYPNSGLSNGDLALASEEISGDLGVATETRFIPLEQLKIPQQPELMLIGKQRYPLQSALVELARQTLPEASCGPFVTVNCCSGHQSLSEELERRTGGICENMEGAAAAQVCTEYRLPLLELRGISNPTGTRDPQQWELERGAEAAQTGLLKVLQHWPEIHCPCDS
jgi:futalosine hydrolase